MQVKSLKDILNIFDYGIVENNAKFHGVYISENIRIYLLDEGREDVMSLSAMLSQINAIIENQFRFTNIQLKDDYIQLRKLILEWLLENNTELEDDSTDLLTYKWL